MRMANSSGLSTRLVYSIGVGLGVTAVSGLSWWYFNCWKKDVMPTNWQRVGTLAEINLFPVKSCAPLKLKADDEIACEILGLRYDSFRDRALMLVDEENVMVTARGYPKMVLIETRKMGPSKLWLSAPGMDTLELDFANLTAEAPGQDVHTSVFGAKVDAMLCGEKYDKWFSKYILGEEHGIKLVYFPYPKPMKPIDADFKKEKYIMPQDVGTFNDVTSYMLMNLSSVKDLNERLTHPIDGQQFRGGFYVQLDADEPYVEDNWSWVKIGDDAVFRMVAPCIRCIFPNINPQTGERDPNGEPLKTLKTYRKSPNYTNPPMGIHLGLRNQGTIKKNDVVYVAVE